MVEDARRTLHFASDLTVEVDGTVGRLVSDGSALVLHTPDPVTVLASARAALPGGQRAVARLADLLAESGASLSVRGEGGETVTIGAVRAGPAARLAGRLATGSPRVAVERPLAFLALAPRRRIALLAATVVAATLWLVSRRRAR